MEKGIIKETIKLLTQGNFHYHTRVKGIFAEESVYEKFMKPIFLPLKIIGLLSYGKENSAKCFFLWRLLHPILFCFPPALFQVLYILHASIEILNIYNGNFVGKLLSVHVASTAAFLCLMPVIFLIENGNLKIYANLWKNFQVCYFTVTKTPLILKTSYQRIITGTLFIVFHELYFLGMRVAYLPLISFVDWISLYSGMFYYLLLGLWVFYWNHSCQLLLSTITILSDGFKKHIKKNSEPIEILENYKCLWFELNGLIIQLGNTFPYTICCLLLYVFTYLMMSTYIVIIFIKTGVLMYLIISIGQLCSCAIILFFTCNNAHYVTYQMLAETEDILKYLPLTSVRRNALTENLICSILVHTQTFLPEIKVGGLITVNRRLLVSMLSMLVTYMVILVQFDMSSQQQKSLNCSHTELEPNASQIYN